MLLSILAVALVVLILGRLTETRENLTNRSVHSTCLQIAQSISSASGVFFAGDAEYEEDIEHWATTSIQSSACSVEPGTAEDVGRILRILGETRTPFAVKGGGHATNPGFSSSAGVQIAMSRFSGVVYDAHSQTVQVGAGVLWDDVYSIVEPLGVNVVGGRQTGVGVAGFGLGGGYSFLTNQYGLSIDNVREYELVLPNGTVTNVTAESNPDLSFALRGGYNNFGVVTKFTLQAYPQGQVWGGLVVMSPGTFDQFNNAILKFIAEVSDPKVGIIATYDSMSGTVLPIALLFYDAPIPPEGIFDDFLAIPAEEQNVGTRSMLSLIQAGGNITGFRAAFDTVPFVQYTPTILDALVNETQFWSERLIPQSATLITWAVELFLPGFLSKHPGIESAYPPSRAQPLLPLCLSFQWNDSSADNAMRDAIVQSAQHLTAVAVAEGQNISEAPVYGNYAINTTPLTRIFGEQMPRLQEIKRQYDPEDVMGLAGGWKIQARE
ncbi:FAD dependent oxidoreductase [Obba rivulosa]|uniref:FAD dependent oxidoreductase n=1 Tax=Obba rivulosa TaxID=1052685 RepID=A0A8E2AIQ6_9APHY|nr:FAD dependent oxidoreductase [Obba rivulosa]